MLLLFVAGILLCILPLAEQTQEFEKDDSVYADLAEQLHETESPVMVLPDPEPTVTDQLENPQPAEEPQEKMTELPTLEVIKLVPVDEIECEEIPQETIIDPSPVIPSELIVTPEETAMSLAKLEEQNPDFVAWLSIPGTVIDYPVVRSNDTERYLHQMFNGQQSKLGCLFSLESSDYETPSQNIAIYGHHLSNSSAMFSSLLNYKDESYWKNHQRIVLNTVYGERTYRIFAVLNQKVTEWDASTATFTSDTAFLKFVMRAQQRAFYDTGITVSACDRILTLITCDRSYGGVQGRLLVMAIEQ